MSRRVAFAPSPGEPEAGPGPAVESQLPEPGRQAGQGEAEAEIPGEDVSAARVQVKEMNWALPRSPGQEQPRGDEPARRENRHPAPEPLPLPTVARPEAAAAGAAWPALQFPPPVPSSLAAQQEPQADRAAAGVEAAALRSPDPSPASGAVSLPSLPSQGLLEVPGDQRGYRIHRMQDASPSPSPTGKSPGAESAATPVQTAFSRALAATTARAPERLAEKLIERLQQACLDEASVGHSSIVWDTPLPGGRRFSDSVARAFAGLLKDLGFLRLEWWSGKEWKDMPGRYCMIHDAMYDKYTLRIRVHWPDSVDADNLALAFQRSLVGRGSAGSLGPGELGGDSVLAPVLQQLQQVLVLQQQLLLQSAAAQAAAEERAARAEARAAAAERRSLGALRARIAGEGDDAGGGPAAAYGDRAREESDHDPDAGLVETDWRELCGV